MIKLKELSWLALGPIISPFLGLLITPLCAWIFPPESIGRLSIYYVFIAILSPILTLSLHQSYVRDYDSWQDKNKLIKTVVYPSFIISIIFIISGLVFFKEDLSTILFGFSSWKISILICISLIINIMQVFLNHIIRMENLSKIFALSQVLQKFFLISILIFILITKGAGEITKDSFEKLLTIITLTLVLSFSYLSYITRAYWINSIKKKFCYNEFKPLINFSFPLIFSDLLFWALNGFDKFYLKEVSGYEMLAVYSMAWTLTNSVTIVSRIFSVIWHPLIYKNVPEIELRKVHKKVISLITLLVITAWFLFGIFGKYLVLVLPESYEKVASLVLLTITTPIFYILSEATGAGIGLSRKSINSFYITGFALALNILLNFLLVPKLGIQGAGIANAISYFIFFILRTEIGKKLWYSFDVKKYYFIIMLFVSYSILLNLIDLSAILTQFFWITLFLISLVILWDDVKSTKSTIKQLKW